MILLVAMNYSGLTQVTGDGDTSSTRIPNVNLRAAVKIIESLRIDSLLMSRDIKRLSDQVTARNMTIRALNGRIETFKLLSANYEKQIGNLSKQNDLASRLTKSLSSQVKRERKKTIIVGIGGVVATALTLYLTTK